MDGSVHTWGSPRDGGDSSAVAAHLTEGVATIYPMRGAFVAVKIGGSAFTWGAPRLVASYNLVKPQLTSGVISITVNKNERAVVPSHAPVEPPSFIRLSSRVGCVSVCAGRVEIRRYRLDVGRLHAIHHFATEMELGN